MANYIVSSGQVSNGIILNNAESMTVLESGVANSTTVNSGGSAYVNCGGTANNATIYSGGSMGVVSGGSVAHIVAFSDALLDFSVAPSTYIEGAFEDSAFEIDGSAINYSVNSGNILRISSGGVAKRTFVYDGGILNISNGGTASRTTVNPGGTMNVDSGGMVDSTTINEGLLYISYGGIANNVALNSRYSEIYISSGGIGSNVVVNYGAVVVSNGGKIDSISFNKNYGTLETILLVESGGTATNINVASDSLALLSFVVAPNTYISGTSANSAFEIKDGFVSNYFVTWNGVLTISSGGTANNVSVNYDGYVNIRSGGIANNTTVDIWGYFNVSSGGEANYTSVYGGTMYVSANGRTNNTIVNGGAVFVYNEATASNSEIYHGNMFISSGGIASDVRINSGGTVTVDHGKLTGKISIADGGVVHAGQGTIIDFDISRLAPGTGVILNNLSLIQADSPGFTLTVSDLQWNGVYTLAKGVLEFDNLVSVKSISNQTIHMMEVGETVNVNGIDYTLNLTDDALKVSVIGGQDVPIITVSADITAITNQDVTLTAGFSDNAIMREYSFDNETWLVYTEPVKCEANGTVYFLGKDQRGFACELASYEVNNINKAAEVYPVVTADVTELTNGDVTLSADFGENSVVREYSLDGETWLEYTKEIVLQENGTVRFRSVDQAGKTSLVSYTVTNIDKIPPDEPTVSADITELTRENVRVSAEFSEDSIIRRYSRDGTDDWKEYTEPVVFTENGTVTFRGYDAAGNMSEKTFTVGNIVSVPLEVPVVSADITTPTRGTVTVSATFSDIATVKRYTLDGKTWFDYSDPLTFEENGSVTFLCYDVLGACSCATFLVDNIDKVAPSEPGGLDTVVLGQEVAFVWGVSVDDSSGVKEYVVTYSYAGQEFTIRTGGTSYVLNNAVFGDYSWTVQAVDFAGNESAATAGEAFVVSGLKPYTVEYSADNFEHVIRFTVTTPELDSFRMPTGTYQLRVQQKGSGEWLTGDSIVAEETDDAPQLVKSDADGNADVFFANAVGTWESGYVAQHVGSIGDWGGTDEYAAVFGKNKLADIIEGSTDANILLMTDDENGDALFVDDIYTALPGSVSEQQSRIAQIDEIRAGAGADIVDMTSQRFEYIGDGLTIRAGAGNDIIWANKGDNRLFGDAGNDRIVGASGNDVIAGGIGNDRMHGGGGNDVFTFCDNWGMDNVEQLAGGTVTLWFASGSIENWDKNTLTYTDGDNRVKVSGVTAEQVNLKFGDDGSDQFATLSGMGAFFDAATERIFEESGKGILVSL